MFIYKNKVTFICNSNANTIRLCITKSWISLIGSKANATITLADTCSMFELPEVDEAQAIMMATERCKAWEYEKATAFDFINQRCIVLTESHCSRAIVTKEYQCE